MPKKWKPPKAPTDFTRDTLLAAQFGYYCRHISLFTDQYFDELQKEYEMVGDPLPIGSDQENDYPPQARALFLYFALSGRIISCKNDLSLL